MGIKPGNEFIVRIDEQLEGDPVGVLVRCKYRPKMKRNCHPWTRNHDKMILGEMRLKRLF